MNQHVRTLGIGIVGDDVALGFQHALVGHLRNHFEELTRLATGSGAHVKDGVSWLRCQYDGGDHTDGFLTSEESGGGLDLEPLMQPCERCIALHRPSINAELIAMGNILDAIGGRDLFNSRLGLVISVCRIILFAFFVSASIASTIGALGIGIGIGIGVRICPPPPVIGVNFDFNFNLLASELIQLLLESVTKLLAEVSAQPERRRKDCLERRDPLETLLLLLSLGRTGNKGGGSVLIRHHAGIVQPLKSVIRLHPGI